MTAPFAAPGDADVHLRRWSDLDLPSQTALLPELDLIFFDASLTKTFASPTARAQFRERWLGRYLTQDPTLAHLALAAPAASGRRALLGYLVGAFDDPARSARFSDIGYFAQLAHLTERFPAHLHVNLSPKARQHGIGSRLLARFASDVAHAGLPGLHVVTGAHSRNVSFYKRNGLVHAHPFTWQGVELVMLAMPVSGAGCSCSTRPGDT